MWRPKLCFAQDDFAVCGTKEKYPFVGVAPWYKSTLAKCYPSPADLRIYPVTLSGCFLAWRGVQLLFPFGKFLSRSNTMVMEELESILAAQGAGRSLPFGANLEILALQACPASVHT